MSIKLFIIYYKQVSEKFERFILEKALLFIFENFIEEMTAHVLNISFDLIIFNF